MSETPEARGMMRGTSLAGDVIARYLDKHDVQAMDAAEHPRFVTVDHRLIEAAASGRDSLGRAMGWTVAQVSLIDSVTRGKRRLRVGWRARAEGVVIPWAEAVRFMTAAKTKKNRPKPGSPEEMQAIETLLRLTRGHQQRTPYRENAAIIVKRPATDAGEDMLAQLLTKPSDIACPICHGSKQNHMGEPCALCVKPLAEQKTNLSVAPDTPPWE
jgi:hypothetical protein